jgi:hypothetical protein
MRTPKGCSAIRAANWSIDLSRCCYPIACPLGQYRAEDANSGEFCSSCPAGTVDPRRVTAVPPRPQAFGLNAIVHRDLGRIDDTVRSQITEAVNAYVKAYGCYPVSVVTDTSGRIVAVNSVTAEGIPITGANALLGRDVSGREWFKMTAARKFTTGAPVDGSPLLSGTVVTDPIPNDEFVTELYGTKAPTWSMTFTAPVTKSDGTLVGYWHNCFSSAMVEQIVADEYSSLKRQGLGTAELNVVDRSGMLILDVDPTETGNDRPRVDDLFKVNFLSSNEAAAVEAARAGAPVNGIVTGRNARMSRATGHEFIQVGGRTQADRPQDPQAGKGPRPLAAVQLHPVEPRGQVAHHLRLPIHEPAHRGDEGRQRHRTSGRR